MNRKTAHSRPWSVHTENNPAIAKNLVVSEGQAVALTINHEGYGSFSRCEADAAVIVHCVNNHDALVRNLKEVCSRLSESVAYYDDVLSKDEQLDVDALKDAHDLLDKLELEKP